MDIFIARQPIFNRTLEVFGYELLFRSSLENFFSHPDQDQAASRVLADSSILFGIETLTGGKKAFVNVTRSLLVKDYASLLPKESTILEILETVEPDEEVVAACRRLRDAGYTLALDDFSHEEKWTSLLDLVDLIKIDFLATTPQDRRRWVDLFAPQGMRFLAEKVENQADFQEASDLGFDYFQGYFFSKPVILAKRNMAGNKLVYLQVLREIHQPGINYPALERLIQQDLTLSYKLLRYIDSATGTPRREVKSIRHALELLGEKEIKKWATLLSLSTMSEHKPIELLVNAGIRARMCEALAKRSGLAEESPDFFLMGLFSMIDALMDLKLDEVLEDVPLTKQVKKALVSKPNSPFRLVFETVLAYEQGDWQLLAARSARLGVPENEISAIYLEAVKWAQELNE